MPPKRGRGGKNVSSNRDVGGRPAKIRKVKEVVFDEDARKEYLTGFSKRKKARELAVRTKAIDREREEKNESRRALRTERKERAATNVRNAQELYGDPGDGDSDDAASEDSDDDQPPKDRAEAAYETSDLITTVLVESFTLSRSPTPDRHPSRSPEPYEVDEDGKGMQSSRASGVENNKKRVRNKPQYRPKMTREDKRERATGGKRKKAGFLKGNSGTKGKGNKGSTA